jgi:hypothetical protein
MRSVHACDGHTRSSELMAFEEENHTRGGALRSDHSKSGIPADFFGIFSAHEQATVLSPALLFPLPQTRSSTTTP